MFFDVLAHMHLASIQCSVFDVVCLFDVWCWLFDVIFVFFFLFLILIIVDQSDLNIIYRVNAIFSLLADMEISFWTAG
jgi:hypothetical protein